METFALFIGAFMILGGILGFVTAPSKGGMSAVLVMWLICAGWTAVGIGIFAYGLSKM